MLPVYRVLSPEENTTMYKIGHQCEVYDPKSKKYYPAEIYQFVEKTTSKGKTRLYAYLKVKDENNEFSSKRAVAINLLTKKSTWLDKIEMRNKWCPDHLVVVDNTLSGKLSGVCQLTMKCFSSCFFSTSH